MSEFAELTPVEARVLGALLEKEMTTPEYYPLTLNALVNACNQKNNRDPITAYAEAEVSGALADLRAKGLLLELSGVGHRVPKYSQRLMERLNLGRREHALLCELLLRGPQTLGELRARAERIHAFSDLEEIESCLCRLAERQEGALVRRMPRQAGTKEERWAQLLGGQPTWPEEAAVAAPTPRGDRVAALEEQIVGLRAEVAALREEFRNFRRQFES